MTDRNPLVLVGGKPDELPVTDALLLAGNPSAAAGGKLSTGQRTLAGREFLASRGSSWGEEALQGLLARSQRSVWRARGGGVTTVDVECAPGLTALGTATGRSPATGALSTIARRAGWVSSATAGNFAGFYLAGSSGSMWTLGAGSSQGGFFAVFRFVPSDAATVSGARMFVGMSSNTSSPSNVEPDTLTNSIGVAAVSGSSNLHIVFGGSSAQAKIDLGSNFPANTLSADVYELILYADPANNGNVGYRVERLNTGQAASGTLTNTTPGTTLPANSTFLCPRGWRCNNTTALAVGLDLIVMSIETLV